MRGAFCSEAENAGVWGIWYLWVYTETMDFSRAVSTAQRFVSEQAQWYTMQSMEGSDGKTAELEARLHPQTLCQNKIKVHLRKWRTWQGLCCKEWACKKCAGLQSHPECLMPPLLSSSSRGNSLTIWQALPGTSSCLSSLFFYLVSGGVCFIFWDNMAHVSKTSF